MGAQGCMNQGRTTAVVVGRSRANLEAYSAKLDPESTKLGVTEGGWSISTWIQADNDRGFDQPPPISAKFGPEAASVNQCWPHVEGNLGRTRPPALIEDSEHEAQSRLPRREAGAGSTSSRPTPSFERPFFGAEPRTALAAEAAPGRPPRMDLFCGAPGVS